MGGKTTKPATVFYLIAGEESGDHHGARLIKAIKTRIPQASFFGHGGNQMSAAGMEISEHIDNLAVMGFTEVIKHLSYFKQVMNETIAAITKIRPDHIILIDYPGFNLRLAKKIAHLKIPVSYFILPQAWAWKEKRVNILRKYVKHSLSIFPFEESWYRQRAVTAQFVGHPFSEMESSGISKSEFYNKHSLASQDQLLVLFPGSRQQEVDRHWPVFLAAAQKLIYQNPDLRLIVGKAPNIQLDPLPPDLLIEEDNPRLALQYGQLVLVASGTATLEAAVFNIPAIVAYRLSAITFFLARLIVDLPYIAMANLIAGKKVVPELLQTDLTEKNLIQAAMPLLVNSDEREKMQAEYQKIRQLLGAPGAYARAAQIIIGQPDG